MRLFAISLRAVIYLLISLLIAAGVGLVSLHVNHQKLLSVQSASMMPTFRRGDALVVNSVKTEQLRVGDIISYQSQRDGAVVISHRLSSVDKQAGLLTTAGDRLGRPDKPFPASQVIGRATAIAPGLGRIMDAIRTPVGLLCLLYLPALAVVGSEIKRLL